MILLDCSQIPLVMNALRNWNLTMLANCTRRRIFSGILRYKTDPPLSQTENRSSGWLTKKKNLTNSGLCRPSGLQNENPSKRKKKKKKKRQVLEPCLRTNILVSVILIVIGAFGTISKSLIRRLEELEFGQRVETIQITKLLSSTGILRRILEETCCHLDSSEIPSASSGLKS